MSEPSDAPEPVDTGENHPVAEPQVALEEDTTPSKTPSHAKTGLWALTLGAIGVVFGDIGTSPLYAMQAVFSPASPHPIAATQTTVYGVVSLIIWAVTVVVSLKYVSAIMRADNEGEGGIMALIALVRHTLGERKQAVWLVALGVFGASLFYGDGMITPAISVLSAVEGLKVVSPGLESVVVPLAIGIIVGLFTIQRFGTKIVGRLFGPIMVGWFSTLAIMGISNIVKHPGVLKALSPTYALEFLVAHPLLSFFALASVVLAVTGAEALYADMGHFGRPAIRRAWFWFVFPALSLNYLGQAALIVHSPGAIASPFFYMVPEGLRIPLVILAGMAAIIASQAVISGAFSVTRQAIQLGFLPRLTVRHTSDQEFGQVYVPVINWGLCVAVLGLIIGFGSSEHLASAYGIAVTGTLVIDTVLFFVVFRALWKRPLWQTVAGAALFLTVDIAFFAANLSKLLHGGWFPLLLAAVVFTLLMTWQRGRTIVTANRIEEEGPLQDFVECIHTMDPPPYRTPGVGVFLNADANTTPLALRANFEHNRVLHENVVIVTVEHLAVPYADKETQIVINHLGYDFDGIMMVTARYGFQDTIDLPSIIAEIEPELETPSSIDQASYFLSKMTIVPTTDPNMSRWRKRLFMLISRNAASPVEYFQLPADQVVSMGSHIDL
jgi:KUP system potassium uptake protein